MVVFAAVLVFQLAGSERQAAERRVAHSARMLAASFEQEMAGSIRTLQALAESDALARGDLEAFLAECVRVRGTQPSWKVVLLIAPDGQSLLNTGVPWGARPPPLAERESFMRVIQTHEPTVGRIATGKGSAGALAFPIRVPVMRDGSLRYVLTAVITPESLVQVVASQGSSGEEWTRSLVDQGGLMAARTRDPARFVGKPAPRSFLEKTRLSNEDVYADVSLDGTEVYVAFSRSPAWGWTASVVNPRRLLDAPLADSMLAVGGLGLALLLVSASGAWVFSRRIERSIAHASAAAAALSRGELPQKAPSSVRELARLGEALEHSGRLLREREAERDAHLAVSEAARAEAVAATRAKDAFLAMLGHELRNPLAPIVTSMDLLRARGLARTPEHEVITRQLQHVVRLVDDLLDVSRITRGHLELRREPVELSSVVTRALEAVAPLIQQRRHVLEADVSPGAWLLADPDRLTQVVANLLTNAAKYTPPGGHLLVRARDVEGGFSLVVEDDGPGLPPDILPRIFEPFVQGPRTVDRSEGGLGLGLALVRSLVEAHGGQVEAHDKGPGQGCTFTVWLPGHLRVERPSSIPGEAPREASPAREFMAGNRFGVLVVDDNVDAAELLTDLLEMNGYEVRMAHDCEEALNRLEVFLPQLVLLDIGLPGVDGYGVAERIRRRLGDASPVFAALTGFGQAEDRARSHAAGFLQHFVKPLNIDDLLAFVESLRTRQKGAA
ncbi:hybrid sensor histidine kinase/response regulator [Melittangium boletus DSM 14713]|uniref:histidine kinase n=1 Tax=Melittangium boletus DSM 14713 TaxID=1294270 RepID=A0A250IL17_9BACT|nr:hybrid sensor histidine kinase/response regulator [Melittangium boletus DSM 14713]